MNYRALKRMVGVCILAGALLYIFIESAVASEFVSVVKDGVNLRSGPDTTYDVLFQLPAGYPLKILERREKWLKVSDYENDKGWIYAGLVSATSHVIVKVKEGNIRSGPGTNNDKVGKVVRDVILRKVEEKGDWLKVHHPELTGWIHQQLVWP